MKKNHRFKVQCQLRKDGYDVRIRSEQNMHMTIRGTSRKVDYYPTTGTIIANPTRKFPKATRLRGLDFERGMQHIRNLSNKSEANANQVTYAASLYRTRHITMGRG